MTQRSDVTTSTGGEAALGGEMKETMPVGLIQILLDRKMKKIHAVDSAGTNRR
jgi:hypothetical protein